MMVKVSVLQKVHQSPCARGRPKMNQKTDPDGYTVYFNGERAGPGRGIIEQQGCCGEVIVKMPVSGIPEDATPLSEVENRRSWRAGTAIGKFWVRRGLFTFSDVFVM